jgi:hypothetical protein
VAVTISNVADRNVDLWTIDLARGVAQRQTDDPGPAA